MKEQGVVARVISGNLVEVAFSGSEACAKCRACHEVGEGMVGIEAVNEVGAKRDDTVEIEIPSEEMVKGSIVVFLLPVFFLIAGYFVGSSLARLLGLIQAEEASGVISALVFAGLSYFVVRWYDVNVQQKEALRARITKIISSP